MQGLWLSPVGAAQGHATFLSRPYRARSLLRIDTQGVALGYNKPPLQGSGEPSGALEIGTVSEKFVKTVYWGILQCEESVKTKYWSIL
jgi:hypothetical protein